MLPKLETALELAGSELLQQVTAAPVQLSSLRKLVVQASVAEAVGLARQGRHSEAEALLGALDDSDRHSPAVLDLLARIRAQQQHTDEAEALWKEALAIDPGNPSYQAALDRLALIRANPVRFPFLWFWVSLAVLACIAGIGIILY